MATLRAIKEKYGLGDRHAMREKSREIARLREALEATDNARMNAEETVARLRLRVDELLNHGKAACEYTDGWDDALLKVVSAFTENAGGQAATVKDAETN